jgi:hypothetical protein
MFAYYMRIIRKCNRFSLINDNTKNHRILAGGWCE